MSARASVPSESSTRDDLLPNHSVPSGPRFPAGCWPETSLSYQMASPWGSHNLGAGFPHSEHTESRSGNPKAEAPVLCVT